MRYIKLCDQSCRSEGGYFSEKEEDFAYFQNQFEAQIINMKLLRVFKGHYDEPEFEKNLKLNASEEAKLRNKQQAREKFDELKIRVWCEIIKTLEKRSGMFLRPYKEDGPKAWAVTCDRYESCERPRLQQLIEKLTNLKMVAKESVIDYITRAEELQSNLREIDDQVSEPMLISIIWIGLTDDFDTICKFCNNMQIQ